MTHKVVAIKCNFARNKLVLTSIGESPRGTKVLLKKVVIANYKHEQPGSRDAVEAALRDLLPASAGSDSIRLDIP